MPLSTTDTHRTGMALGQRPEFIGNDQLSPDAPKTCSSYYIVGGVVHIFLYFTVDVYSTFIIRQRCAYINDVHVNLAWPLHQTIHIRALYTRPIARACALAYSPILRS